MRKAPSFERDAARSGLPLIKFWFWDPRPSSATAHNRRSDPSPAVEAAEARVTFESWTKWDG